MSALFPTCTPTALKHRRFRSCFVVNGAVADARRSRVLLFLERLHVRIRPFGDRPHEWPCAAWAICSTGGTPSLPAFLRQRVMLLPASSSETLYPRSCARKTSSSSLLRNLRCPQDVSITWRETHLLAWKRPSGSREELAARRVAGEACAHRARRARHRRTPFRRGHRARRR